VSKKGDSGEAPLSELHILKKKLRKALKKKKKIRRGIVASTQSGRRAAKRDRMLHIPAPLIARVTSKRVRDKANPEKKWKRNESWGSRRGYLNWKVEGGRGGGGCEGVGKYAPRTRPR